MAKYKVEMNAIREKRNLMYDRCLTSLNPLIQLMDDPKKDKKIFTEATLSKLSEFRIEFAREIAKLKEENSVPTANELEVVFKDCLGRVSNLIDCMKKDRNLKTIFVDIIKGFANTLISIIKRDHSSHRFTTTAQPMENAQKAIKAIIKHADQFVKETERFNPLDADEIQMKELPEERPMTP